VQEVKKHTVKIEEEALACSAEEQARTRRKVDQTYIKLDTAEKVLNSIYSLLYDRLGSVKKEQCLYLELLDIFMLSTSYRDRIVQRKSTIDGHREHDKTGNCRTRSV